MTVLRIQLPQPVLIEGFVLDQRFKIEARGERLEADVVMLVEPAS
ncbi:hypothetical protein [Bradyrhizobium sp. CB3481]|nr:hypothetical protein [Bradyrhizobium sp. CB3481]WFU14923.1 hypothetical protein QA643_28605 [Bradyrhizobium sp. CB3481]